MKKTIILIGMLGKTLLSAKDIKVRKIIDDDSIKTKYILDPLPCRELYPGKFPTTGEMDRDYYLLYKGKNK